MFLKISEQNRDEIVKAVIQSELPTRLGVQIINVLNGLEKIVEKKEEVKPTK